MYKVDFGCAVEYFEYFFQLFINFMRIQLRQLEIEPLISPMQQKQQQALHQPIGFPKPPFLRQLTKARFLRIGLIKKIFVITHTQSNNK